MYDDNEDIEDEFEQNEMDEEIEDRHRKVKHYGLDEIDLMGGGKGYLNNGIEIPDYASHVDKKLRSRKSENFFNPEDWSF